MKQAARQTLSIGHKSIWCKIKSFLMDLSSESPCSCPPVSLFLIRRDMLDEFALQDLNSQKQLLTLLGWKVIERELEQQMSDGCIGFHLHFDSGRLIFQERLQIKVEHVEKKILSSERIDLSVRLVPEDLIDSFP